MKVSGIHNRLLIFLTAALVLACVISPWLALGADWFGTKWPDLLSQRVAFGKVFNRAFMIAAMMLFIAYRRALNPPELKRLLTPGLHVAVRNFLAGWGLTVFSMVVLVTAMAATEVFRPYLRVSWTTGLSRLAGALLAGLSSGFLEEIFFRGMLFLGIFQTGHRLRAYLLANLFYSAIHFVKPGEGYFLDDMDVLAGFRHLITTFHPFLDLYALLPGIIGLLLVGVVLSYALERTGNLWLSIGLHAGWIVSLKLMKVFGNFSRADLGWVFGSGEPKIVSGVATWVGIMLVGLAVSQFTRRAVPLASDQPHATAA